MVSSIRSEAAKKAWQTRMDEALDGELLVMADWLQRVTKDSPKELIDRKLRTAYWLYNESCELTDDELNDPEIRERLIEEYL